MKKVIGSKGVGLILFSLLVLAIIPLAAAKETSCVYYFYGQSCPLCKETDTFINKLESKYQNLEINKFEVYFNSSNRQTLQGYFDAYEVPSNKQGVPVVFLPEQYFIGPKSIIDYLEGSILNNEKENCPPLKKSEALGIIGEKSPKNLFETLTFFSVTGSAVKDSVNPCALAVLLILLAILLAAVERKRKVLRTGAAFTLSIYVSYFLFGIGLLSVLRLAGISYYFYKVVGFLALVIGLLNVKDYYWYGKVFFIHIPHKWKPVLEKILKGITTSAGAFIVGFAVCLFELSCSGETFRVLRGLLADKGTHWAAIPWLLYYNLVFILPLIVSIWIMYKIIKNIKGDEKEEKKDIHGEIEKLKKKNIRLLHLIVGVVMVILGILVLFFL